MTEPGNVEPKWKALKRLEAEGRLKKFQERYDFYKQDRKTKRTEAFYMALKEFPPLVEP